MMIKAIFGDSLKSKNRVAQENELLCKILAHIITVLIQAMLCGGFSQRLEIPLTEETEKISKPYKVGSILI